MFLKDISGWQGENEIISFSNISLIETLGNLFSKLKKKLTGQNSNLSGRQHSWADQIKCCFKDFFPLQQNWARKK